MFKRNRRQFEVVKPKKDSLLETILGAIAFAFIFILSMVVA